jgi:hypothetical protein
MADVRLCRSIEYELAADHYQTDFLSRKSAGIVSLPALDRNIDLHSR